MWVRGLRRQARCCWQSAWRRAGANSAGRWVSTRFWNYLPATLLNLSYMAPRRGFLRLRFWSRRFSGPGFGGPVGLLLSTPLTVCLVVVGRYVPHLEFLGILFGDEPALSPAQRFYQRMIASEAEDAAELTEQLVREQSRVEVYDNVIIPAISLAEEGRHAGFIDSATAAYFLENTRELTDEIGSAGYPEPK